MRLFEWLTLLVLALFVLSIFVKASKRFRCFHLLPAVALVLILVHALAEGIRWQMWPVYFYALGLFLATAKNIKYAAKSSERAGNTDRKWLRLTGGTIAFLLLVAIALPPLLIPVFNLPDPSGPYPVGTLFDCFQNTNQPDIPNTDPNSFRGISLQAWYPAEINVSTAPMRYWQRAGEQSRVISKFWGGLPSFLFSHFSLVKTHSIPNAPLSQVEPVFPVLVFNHGSLGLPSLHSALMEDLASQGYIVFSIGHADYIPFFILPGGRIKAFDPHSEEIESKMRENTDPQVREMFSRLALSREPGEQTSLYRRFLAKNPRNQESLRRWAGEIAFVIGQLEKLNVEGSIFSKRMNLDQLGVFGVSFGGAAAVQACINDERVKAAINIDCPQFGDLLDHELRQPVMFMDSEQYRDKNDLFLKINKNPVYDVLVHGTTHQNFSDICFWGAFFKMQMLGKINAARCQRIQNVYVLAFFEKYLRGRDNRLLAGPSPAYPEVDIRLSNRE
ncbi:MAG TPA: hypothetical protein VMZ49_08190 [Patescibacteria group bacterium]|nr:hypothetical protein [Patescibacteria group bacterium]